MDSPEIRQILLHRLPTFPWQVCRQEWSKAKFAKINLAFLTQKGEIETQFSPIGLIL
jgi:hypothetical protein